MASSVMMSCKKEFLEVVPKGKLVAEKTKDYDLMIAGYRSCKLYPHIAMGDEVVAFAPEFGGSNSTLVDQRSFRYEDDVRLASEDKTEWVVLMYCMYPYNKIINEVMNSKDGSEGQKKTIRAEALVNRALYYFWLANYYGKPYNEATATTDLAVPKILTADVTPEKYTRATVKEIFDLMVSDLIQAIPDLPLNYSNQNRVCKATGEALLGKIYVFMGQFDKALPLLESAKKQIAAETRVGLYDYAKELAAGGAFTPYDDLEVGPNRFDATLDREVLWAKFTYNFHIYYQSDLLLSPQTVALYTSGDTRLTHFTASNSNLLGYYNPYPHGMRRRWGSYYSTIGMNVADVYLLDAECKSRLNDLSGAVSELENFRKKRMPAAQATVPATIAADRIALTKFILEERIREFAMQGDRWLDMRRLSVDPTYKSTVGTKHILYNADGTVKDTYTLRPERLTLRIPLYIANSNSDMPQNQ